MHKNNWKGFIVVSYDKKIWHIIFIILMSEVVINENVHHHKEEYEFDIIRPVLACL